MRIAVVLFNLGGPDSLEAVQPFLRNLFSDRAIIGLPGFLRLPLARFISSRRASKAKEIYRQIGGSSPILGQTEAQARALEGALGHDEEWRAFVCMRYWHPMTEKVVQRVRKFGPDWVVLLPLYPQYSTTTTGSSFKIWRETVARLNVPTQSVRSYPTDEGFRSASVELIKQGLADAGSGPVRLLFSAHGLPVRIVKAGDPYQSQVEETARAISARLDGVDSVVCYQSRVGPLKWIGPSTETEIRRAAADKVGIVLYPLSFVSEYRHLAEKAGVTTYVRVPTVGTHPLFIGGLAKLVRSAMWPTNS